MGEAIIHATSAAVPAGGMPSQAERFWNLPNVLTLLRMAAVPVLLFMPLLLDEWGSQLMAWVFIAAATTDVVDGWLARRGQQMLVATSLIMLVAVGRIETWAAWMVVVIVGRELAVTGLRGIASAGGRVMAASWQGKVKAVTQNVAIGALLFHYETLRLPAHELGLALLFVATLLTLWSGYVYFAAYFRSIGVLGRP